MNASTLQSLLTARQRDLIDNERDIRKYSERLLTLKAERAQIEDDIHGLTRRLEGEKPKGERNIDENY